MKTKLFILATTSLFSLGLALYANHSNSIDVLGSSDVEALSINEGIPVYIQETGEFPYRTWINHVSQTVTLESYRKILNEFDEYECVKLDDYTCMLTTATPISNATTIFDRITEFLKEFFHDISPFEWIKKLFKKED